MNNSQTVGNVPAYLGEVLVLECEVHGVPTNYAPVFWFMDDKLIDNGKTMFNKLKCLKSVKLFFYGLQYNDSGNYSCVYFNNGKKYSTGTIDLDVHSRQRETSE